MNDQLTIHVPEDLLKQTVIISDTSSKCGNCNKNALPAWHNRCPECGAIWHFSASRTRFADETDEQLAASMEKQFPNFAFVGYSSKGIDAESVEFIPSPKARKLVHTLRIRRSMLTDAKMAAVCVAIGMVLFLVGIPLGGLLLDLLGLWGLACVVTKRRGWFNRLGIPLMTKEDWRKLSIWRRRLYIWVWSEYID